MIYLKQFLLPAIFAILPLSMLAQQFGGNPSSIKWQQVNTLQSRVIFPAGLDSQAQRISNINSLLANTTAYSIGGRQRKWNILLLNQTIIPNAYVRLAPVMSEFFMTPAQDNFSLGSLRWDDNLIIHENRHMQQFSNFNNGLTKVFSFFLGQEGQLLANGITIPDYFFEGDAVWQETLVSAQGRGRLPSFYNSIKSLTLANKKYSWMKLRSGSLKDLTPDFYELGYQLVAYGNEKYGSDFWKKVSTDAVRFKGLFYSFNNAIERHSGETYPQFRKHALAYFIEQSIDTNQQNQAATNYITPVEKNNVVDYLYPVFAGNDSILVTKKSYRHISSFYLLRNGTEQHLRVKDLLIDDYFSYRNGRIVYATYKPDVRRRNRNFNVIQLLDLNTGRQQQLTASSKYFSPDISEDGKEIIAVSVNPNGSNELHRLSVATCAIIGKLPNPRNYFYTQTKYINSTSVISAVRNDEGKMCLIKIDLNSGESERITPFSFNLIGYPLVKGDTVYFNAMNKNADKIFAVRLSNKKIYRLTNNVNGVYHPAVNNKGELIVSAFTANGQRLAQLQPAAVEWIPVTDSDFTDTPDLYTKTSLRGKAAGILYTVSDTLQAVTPYRKTFQLFNLHSRRPEANDPEYSYHFYSDNVLSSFSNTLSYTFNRSDRSHKLGFYESFAGWLPVITMGGEYHFNRSVDTAVGKSIDFNSAKLNAGIYIPLNFVGGRTITNLTFGGGYNIEQLLYRGIGKNVFDNLALKYANAFASFSNANRQARQHINPRWAQSFTLLYRDAFTLINSHKLVANTAFYFPGLFTNHSLVINASYQKRDTLRDLFSNTFSYSRGYEALSTRRMYKLGANYHFPLLYPDWGFGNIIFFQRIRANAFYDHTVARARLNNVLTNIKQRSTGAEIYFDTKVWNALPVSFGFRYSRLADTDFNSPGRNNYWEFIVPIGLIPD